MLRFLKLWVICLLILNGCTSSSTIPALKEHYGRAAQHTSPHRNPVIVIPGVVGSKLIDSDTERLVWGAFSGNYADPKTPGGARLCDLPMREGAALSELRDQVVPAGVVDRFKAKVLGLPIELDAYVYILGTLGVGGYRDEEFGLAGSIDYGDQHFTCFQFDYDWRRDNSENAHRLHEFILKKRAYVQAEIAKRFGIADYDVKFDIVAHSMGGLITRYYLRYGPEPLPEDGSLPPVTWAGSRYVEQAVLIGTPNAGSVRSLLQLVYGRKAGPTLPTYEPSLLGTMPAIYQLLPRARHGALVDASDSSKRFNDIFDPELWKQMGWGLAAPDQDRVLRMLLPGVEDTAARRRIALDHQRKCLARAKQFSAALEVPAPRPKGLSLHLIAGDGLLTDAVVSVNKKNGIIKVIDRDLGDGMVLRSSALLDERLGGTWQPTLVSPISWTRVTFMFKGHLEMTRDPEFTDNLLFLLLEQPR